MSYVIEKDIPIPECPLQKKAEEFSEFLDTLKVSDSVLTDDHGYYTTKLGSGKKFETRMVENNKIRIWRTE